MEEFRRCCIARDSASAMTIFSTMSEGMKKRATRRIMVDGSRTIHLLAEVCIENTIFELVEYGRNKNACNSHNQTPIMIAAQHNNISAFTALFGLGATRCTPIDRCKKYQKTIDLYEVVFMYGRCDMLKMLLDDPNSHLVDDGGCTSLLRGGNMWVYRLACQNLELLDVILNHTERCRDGWSLDYRLGYMLAEAAKAKSYAGVTMILDRNIQSLNCLVRNLSSYSMGDVRDVTMTRLLVDRCDSDGSKLLMAAACLCPSEVMRVARSYVIDEEWFAILRIVTYVSSVECLEIVFCVLYDKIRKMPQRLCDFMIRHINVERFFHISFVDQIKRSYRIPRYADGAIPHLREIAHHHLRLIPIRNSLRMENL